MGVLDCFTTVVGTMFFGTVELNPIIAGLLYSNVLGFVAVKLAVTFSIAFILVWADRALIKLADQSSAILARKMLLIATFGVLFFLIIVVVNNVLVLVQIIW
jgi:hypothetical protein